MGNTINKVDEGLFICGVEALRDFSRLRALGIKCILNAAQRDLYSDRFRSLDGDQDCDRLSDIEKNFEVKIIGADDDPGYNLSAHFAEIADFIEAGRAKGGVVVHCAAGISRASTSTLAYMMIKEHLLLRTAFTRVHTVRERIQPNVGFWRQLRDLEHSLQVQGVTLGAGHTEWTPPQQPEDEEAPKIMAAEAEEGANLKMARLDQEISKVDSFVTHYLTARVTPTSSCVPTQLADRIKQTRVHGLSWEQVNCSPNEVELRVGLVPTLDSVALKQLICVLPGVQSCECE